MATPNKYKKKFAKQLPDMFKNGESVAEVCMELGIPRQTFYYWVNNYDDFKEAYETGKMYSEAWWTKLGRAGALGKTKIQPTVWIFNMKNKFGWRDQAVAEGEGEQGVKMDINFTVSQPVDEIKVTKGQPVK